MTNIRYAGDNVLIAEIADDLQRLVNVAVSESDRKGLSMTVKGENIKQMMRIPWMDKVSNARVLRLAKVNRMVMAEIRRGQLQLLG